MSYINGFIFSAVTGYLIAGQFGGLVGIAIYTGLVEVASLAQSYNVARKTRKYLM